MHAWRGSTAVSLSRSLGTPQTHGVHLFEVCRASPDHALRRCYKKHRLSGRRVYMYCAMLTGWKDAVTEQARQRAAQHAAAVKSAQGSLAQAPSDTEATSPR